MTDQQANFINAYFDNNFNATKAAEIAGYGEPRQRGWDVKNLPEVKVEIERRLALYAMSANEVLTRLATQARATIADCFEMQGRYPVFNPEKAFESGAIDFVKRFSKDPDGSVTIEMYDAQAALVHIGRHHKLFTDKVENTNPDALELLREALGVQENGNREGTEIS